MKSQIKDPVVYLLGLDRVYLGFNLNIPQHCSFPRVLSSPLNYR